MRTALAVSVLAVGGSAAAASGGKKAPLIHTGVLGDFLRESILLSRDLTLYTASTAASTAWGVVPPEHQKLISEQYQTVSDQFETLRLQNGIVTPAAAFSEATEAYNSKVYPVLARAYEVVTKAAEKPFTLLKSFIANFEKAYPDHAGLLSSISIWDLLLTLFFIVYFVLGYTKKAICYVICCGACRKRASAALKPQLVKKGAAPPIKANGVGSKKR
jgi:hypothetical protein